MTQRMVDVWAELEPAWQECFLLAWRSFQTGSIPVGAALVDGEGAIVATGRNLRNEEPTPDGQIAGSSIAHAEINALAALPPGAYPDHVLYTTLEPCLLCTAALRYSHVGTVRFAAADPMWYGIDGVPKLNHHLARGWTRREGPLGGPLETWAAVLHLISAVERDAQLLLAAHVEVLPEAVRAARELAGDPARELRDMSLLRALEVVSDLLVGS